MPSTEITSMTASAFSFCSLTHTRTHLPQAYRNIWRYETAPHKMLSSAFAQFFQSCPYWFPPARPADPVSVPPRYVAFLNSSGTPSHHITIPLIFRDSRLLLKCSIKQCTKIPTATACFPVLACVQSIPDSLPMFYSFSSLPDYHR